MHRFIDLLPNPAYTLHSTFALILQLLAMFIVRLWHDVPYMHHAAHSHVISPIRKSLFRIRSTPLYAHMQSLVSRGSIPFHFSSWCLALHITRRWGA